MLHFDARTGELLDDNANGKPVSVRDAQQEPIALRALFATADLSASASLLAVPTPSELAEAARCAENLDALLSRYAILSFRTHMITEKLRCVRSLVHPDTSTNPYFAFRPRTDLAPMLASLSEKLDTFRKEQSDCAVEMVAAMRAFSDLHASCKHSREINLRVAAELQQVGVFAAATNKLIIADILLELCNRIDCHILFAHNDLGDPGPCAIMPWPTLIRRFSKARKQQEQVYSATFELMHPNTEKISKKTEAEKQMLQSAGNAPESSLSAESATTDSFANASPAIFGTKRPSVFEFACAPAETEPGDNSKRKRELQNGDTGGDRLPKLARFATFSSVQQHSATIAPLPSSRATEPKRSRSDIGLAADSSSRNSSGTGAFDSDVSRVLMTPPDPAQVLSPPPPLPSTAAPTARADSDSNAILVTSSQPDNPAAATAADTSLEETGSAFSPIDPAALVIPIDTADASPVLAVVADSRSPSSILAVASDHCIHQLAEGSS
ncbi:hypothetical protein HDU83_005169 [Entophlyctis luteolus]|nr:hypothetical protein HDU83_005169 [Entophlyctis luteolus]